MTRAEDNAIRSAFLAMLSAVEYAWARDSRAGCDVKAAVSLLQGIGIDERSRALAASQPAAMDGGAKNG